MRGLISNTNSWAVAMLQKFIHVHVCVCRCEVNTEPRYDLTPPPFCLFLFVCVFTDLNGGEEHVRMNI